MEGTKVENLQPRRTIVASSFVRNLEYILEIENRGELNMDL